MPTKTKAAKIGRDARKFCATITAPDTLTVNDLQAAVRDCIADHRESQKNYNEAGMVDAAWRLQAICEARPRLLSQVLLNAGYSFDL